ncbi:hypothetical protein [Halorarius litoreus]|uniref:hypothetical protein n=1 Tax=Halorarius litoreus TaxID=2962676 RepID=UPI0020CCB48A|nr:hypothetical protein [Halorarius litoreus]
MARTRRSVLGVTAASLAGLAGCIGSDPEDLRFRNFTSDRRELTVRIWNERGEQAFDETVELAANFAGEQPEQPTRRGVFTSPGTYEVTAFLPDGPTETANWTVEKRETYHVSVYDGPELTLGELGP